MMKFGTEKKDNRQLENAYIFYMIFSSYFHKCICRSTTLEKKLMLYYKEMSQAKQESAEAEAIRAAENVLDGWKDTWEISDCEAHIGQKGQVYLLRFFTGLEELRIEIDKKGKYSIDICD